MASINLLGNYAKTKVSLALDEGTVNILDRAVMGLREIYMLSRNDGQLASLTGEKNYPLFKNLLNRSEIVNNIINAVKDEKIFEVGSSKLSIMDLVDFANNTVDLLDFDYMVDFTKVCTIHKVYYDFSGIDDFKQNIRDLSVQETIRLFSNDLKGIEFGLPDDVYFEILDDIVHRDIASEGLFEEIDQMYKQDKEFLNRYYYEEPLVNAQLKGDMHFQKLYDIISEVVKYSNLSMTVDLKCRVLRNILFEEKNDTRSSVLDAYFRYRTKVINYNVKSEVTPQ